MNPDSLAIVLEYAYRGVAAQGAKCHIDRMISCPLCDALYDAEDELATAGIEPPERVWWRNRWQRWFGWLGVR